MSATLKGTRFKQPRSPTSSMKRNLYSSHDEMHDKASGDHARKSMASKTYTVEPMNYHCLKSSSFTDSSECGDHFCHRRFCDESSDSCGSMCSCKTSIITSRDSRSSDCTSFTRLKICAKKSKKRRNLLDNNFLSDTLANETSDFSSVSVPVKSIPSQSDGVPSLEWSLERNSEETVEMEERTVESGLEDLRSSEFTPLCDSQAMAAAVMHDFPSSSQCTTTVVHMVHVSSSSPALLRFSPVPLENEEEKQPEGEGNVAVEEEGKERQADNAERKEEEEVKETVDHESEEAPPGLSSVSVDVQISQTPNQNLRPRLASILRLSPPASTTNYGSPTDDADSPVSPEEAAATSAQAHIMLKDLLALRTALRLSAKQTSQKNEPSISRSPSTTSTSTSASSRGPRFRPPFRMRTTARLQDKMEAQYTSYLVHLLEEQSVNQNRPQGGKPNKMPMRLPLPQLEHRPLPPLAVNLYCQAERMMVSGEYEAALILFSRGALLHPDSPRFQAGITKAKKAIEHTVESASRLLLGDGFKSKSKRRQSHRLPSFDHRTMTHTLKKSANPAKLAAEACANSTLGMRPLYERVVRFKMPGRDVIDHLMQEARDRRAGAGAGAGGFGEGILPVGDLEELKKKRLDVTERVEPWYTVPFEGTRELLVGTIADIAKFIHRREEYWKRLPGPLHVPAVANLRDPKSAPLLHKQGGQVGSNSYASTISPTASGVGAKDAAHDRSEKRIRAQMAQMEEAVRERRFADVLTLGGQLLRALEARRPLAPKQADRDTMIVTAQNYITVAHIERGELDSAARISERMLRRARGLPDQRLLASALATAGRLRAAAGQLGWAAACWEQMVPLVQDDETRAWLFHELGRCSFQLHELQTARKYGEWSLSAARRANSARWALNAALLSAQTEMQDGHYAAAHTFLEEARPFCAQLQDAAAAAYIRDAERLILTDRLPTVVVNNKSKREAAPTPASTPGKRPQRESEMGGAGEGNVKSLCLPARSQPSIPVSTPVPAGGATPAPATATSTMRVSRRGSGFVSAPAAASASANAAATATAAAGTPPTHARSASGAP